MNGGVQTTSISHTGRPWLSRRRLINIHTGFASWSRLTVSCGIPRLCYLGEKASSHQQHQPIGILGCYVTGFAPSSLAPPPSSGIPPFTISWRKCPSRCPYLPMGSLGCHVTGFRPSLGFIVPLNEWLRVICPVYDKLANKTPPTSSINQ